jgi:hypothetical protein
MAGPSTRDRQMECFLLEARVVKIHEVIAATTVPMWVDLQLDGKTGMAVFKYSDKTRAAEGEGESASAGQGAAHGYRYEVAAYRLDRTLGLDMVPVTVSREVNTRGALIEWIADAQSVEQLRDAGKSASDLPWLSQQIAVMNLFDALILNRDRQDSDQLIVPGSSKLHLIDHGRAFGDSGELPESFTANPVSLPRNLLNRLEQLTAESLKERLGGSLTDAEIAVLLERRDAILDKIATDRQQYGDSNVFQD